MKMGKTVVILEEQLDREFRAQVARKFGSKKGSLGMAITEAVKLWMKANKA